MFISNARGSLCEVETQLEIAGNLNYLDKAAAELLLAKACEVARKLNGLREWAAEN